MIAGRKDVTMDKKCVICGATFRAPPSSKKVTCSPACRSVRAARAAKTAKRRWSDDARKRRASDERIQARMEDLSPVGMALMRDLPEGQRGPQHRSSKVWELIDPNGRHITAVNLSDWSRANYALFEPDSLDPEATANRIIKGFGAIASSMRGVKSRKRPVSIYKGWGLAKLPYDKEDKL